MAEGDNLDLRIAELDISNEENEEWMFDEEAEETGNRFELCLVGSFLTEKSLNVRVMKSKMADIWKPAMGINIKTLRPGLYLFQFYHKDDMMWMMNNGPWTFDNAILVTSIIPAGGDPTKVPLHEVEFWIQLYDIPSGLMTEAVGKQLGNFFGSFVKYDSSNNTSIWREYMRLRIKVDVRRPLKRKKKICRRDRTECVVHCKYEKLGDFCFLCGLLTHTERFCKKRLEKNVISEEREWGGWLRAPTRRGAVQGRSKWLRDEGTEEWGGNLGSDKDQGSQNSNAAQSGGSYRQERKVVEDISGFLNYDKKGVREGELEGNVSKEIIGPDPNELDGLIVEERKRQRTGTNDNMDLDKNFNTSKPGSGLSSVDCTESSSHVLATLALQASHRQ